MYLAVYLDQDPTVGIHGKADPQAAELTGGSVSKM